MCGSVYFPWENRLTTHIFGKDMGANQLCWLVHSSCSPLTLLPYILVWNFCNLNSHIISAIWSFFETISNRKYLCSRVLKSFGSLYNSSLVVVLDVCKCAKMKRRLEISRVPTIAVEDFYGRYYLWLWDVLHSHPVNTFLTVNSKPRTGFNDSKVMRPL